MTPQRPCAAGSSGAPVPSQGANHRASSLTSSPACSATRSRSSVSKTTAELRTELEENTAALARIDAEQAALRLAAIELVRKGQKQLAALDKVTAPLESKRQRILAELNERHARTLDRWEIDTRYRWETSNRYLIGREHNWCTHVAWLRVGLWLPQPRWFLDINTYSNGIKGGQYDLGPPVESDPNDGARVRALADALLIKAGCLLTEQEGEST